MNYDEELQKVIVAIKGDKAIVQPWRNKATARIEEAQAFIRMGKSLSTQTPPGDSAMKFPVPQPQGCICQPDMPLRKDCPVHRSV